MKATVITHVFNEAFLLPYWLRHHRRLFDHGIIIDYASTDASTQIVQELAPDWDVIESPHADFSAEQLDRLVEEVEAGVDGVKIALTVTEFLLGDPRSFPAQEIAIPSVELLDMPSDPPFVEGVPFHEQRHHGIHYHAITPYRACGRGRLMHTSIVDYPIGRHVDARGGGAYLIYRVAGCLVNDAMVERRLQIQTRIPTSEIERGYGVQHHAFGTGLTRDKVLAQLGEERLLAEDMTEILDSAVRRQEIAIALRSPAATVDSDVVEGLVEERDALLGRTDEQTLQLERLQESKEELRTQLHAIVDHERALVQAERNRATSLEGDIAQLQDKVGWLETTNASITDQVEYLERAVGALSADREQILGSISWRITSPLRSVLALARRLLGR